MFHPVLSKQVKYYKETEGGLKEMCKAVEDLANSWVLEDRKENARRLIEAGKISLVEATEFFDLSVEAVEELRELLVEKN